jgi:hypothetical protein
MNCLMLGTAEHVNLKAMYPKTYGKLNRFLEQHRAKIRAMRQLAGENKTTPKKGVVHRS